MDFSKEFCLMAFNASNPNKRLDADMFCFICGISYSGYREVEYQNSI